MHGTSCLKRLYAVCLFIVGELTSDQSFISNTTKRGIAFQMSDCDVLTNAGTEGQPLGPTEGRRRCPGLLVAYIVSYDRMCITDVRTEYKLAVT
jgi:hypothetical protein